MERTVAGTTYDYVFDNQGKENTQGSAGFAGWNWSELYLGGMHVNTYTDGSTYFSHADHLGSERMETDPTGNTNSSAQTNLPFGEWTSTGLQSGMGFTGDLHDDGGVFHTPFRQYSQAQGRWMIPDPAGLAAVDPTNPQTWNRYAYVTNNPTSFTDPTGLVSIPNVGDYFGGGGGGFNCTQDGVDQSCNTVYSVLQGGGAVVCPNNNCAPQWNGSAWTYFSAFADGTQGYYQMGMAPQQNSLLGVPASGDPATAACIAKGLQSAFPGSTVSAGASTDEVGGHWNFYVTLQFPSQSAFNAFDSTYDSASNGWPPPARFGDGPALHLENLGNFGDGTFGVVGTAHIDLFNPDTGIGGIAGHVGDDVVWGHIVQFFGGNIDPKACPFQ